MTRLARARLGMVAGLALITLGLYLAVGLGWALVAAGTGIYAGFVVLYDVSESDQATPYPEAADNW